MPISDATPWPGELQPSIGFLSYATVDACANTMPSAHLRAIVSPHFSAWWALTDMPQEVVGTYDPAHGPLPIPPQRCPWRMVQIECGYEP